MCIYLYALACVGAASWSASIPSLSTEMKELANQLPEVLSNSRADSTVTKYQGAWARWAEWADEQGVPSLPADPFHIALYLVKLLQDASSPAPIVAAVCSIKWQHDSHGWPNPCSNQVVANVQQAAKRVLAKPTLRKKPMTKVLLQSLSASLSTSSSLQDLQTLTLLTVGFAGLLRWDDLSHIHVDEIEFRETYMAVFLEKRKNDQFRHGHWVLISRWSGELCPVKLTESLLEMGGQAGHSPLFGRVYRRHGKQVIKGSMSYSRARELIRGALERVGEDPDAYGLHSLRSGGASVAAAAGIPDRLIQSQGGWRSESAMHNYFEESIPALLQVSRSLAAE